MTMVPRDVQLPESATVPIRRPAPATPREATVVPAVPRPMPTAQPTGLSSSPDLPALLKALQRRWLLVLGLGLLFAPAAGAAAWYLLSARYTAFAQLHISATQPGVLAKDPEGGRAGFAIYQKTQAKRLRFRPLLSTVLADDAVKNLPLVRQQVDPLTWLEDDLRVEFQEGNEIMTVLLSGANPTDLVTVVDTLLKHYETQTQQGERDQRQTRLKELEGIYTAKDASLRKDKEELRRLADKLETSDEKVLAHRHIGLISDIAEMRRLHGQKRFELLDARRKLDGYKAQVQARGKPAPTPPPPVKEEAPPEIPTLGEALEADREYKERDARVTRLRDTVKTYERLAVQPDEPTLIRERRRLLEEEKLLEERKSLVQTELARLTQLVGEKLKEKKRPPQELPPLPSNDNDPMLAQLQAEYVSLESQEKELAGQVLALEEKARKIGSSPTELERLRSKIQLEQQLADNIWSQTELLRAELGARPRVTIDQPAGLQKRDMKRQVMAAGLAPGLVLAAIALGVAWLEFRTRRIRSAGEVVAGLGIRVIGSVPPLRRQATREQAEAVESIDALRTLLLREASAGSMRVVLVTSASHGEAKTTLACNLADSLARAGRRTLLIDCDLRRPAAHQLFELPLQPGFSEMLLGEVDPMDAIQATSSPGLWLIAAGQWDRGVIQALSREGTLEILDKLKEEYDFVILDSHPILEATDSLLLAQHADAVLLSVLRDVSRSPKVYTASQRLSALGVRVLGAVVNGAAPDDVYASGGAQSSNPTRT